MARNISAREPAYQYTGVIRVKITYLTAATTVITDIGKIPAYASVIGGGVHILTAFNDSGTDTLDVGFRGGSATADPDGYATLLDLSAVGFIVLDELAATTNIMSTSANIVTVRYNGQNSNASLGVAYVSILYSVGPVDGS